MPTNCYSDGTCIAQMSKIRIMKINPDGITKYLTSRDIIHIFHEFGAFFNFDFSTLGTKKVGPHPVFQGEHLCCFCWPQIALEEDMICRIMARQIIKKYRWLESQKMLTSEQLVKSPDYIAGVPNGGTKLAQFVARELESEVIELHKRGGHISVLSEVMPGKDILMVNDLTLEGHDYVSTYEAIKRVQPKAEFIDFGVTILRGRYREIISDDYGVLKVHELAKYPINKHGPEDVDHAGKCKLCRGGSEGINPKLIQNWYRLIGT